MNNKTWILLGIIVLLIIAGGAYMIGKSRNIQETVIATEEPMQTQTANTDGVTETKEADGKYIGFLTDVNTNPASLTIDYIQWIGCQTDTQTGECMNGFKIVNQNPLLRTFDIAPSTPITMQTYNVGLNPNESITLSQLANAIVPGNHLMNVPFWITVQGGVVTEINEQYVP